MGGGAPARASRGMTILRARLALSGAHRVGSDQLDNLDRRRDAIDRMLAAVDAAVPDALGLDAKSMTMTQLVDQSLTLVPAANSAEVTPRWPRLARAARHCATRPIATCSGPPETRKRTSTTSLVMAAGGGTLKRSFIVHLPRPYEQS